MSDKGRLEFEFQKIVHHLLEVPKSGYETPFQALYNTCRQQLTAALKSYQEIKAGGKYLHKLPRGITQKEGKALARDRLIRQIKDTLHLLKADVKAKLLSAVQLSNDSLTLLTFPKQESQESPHLEATLPDEGPLQEVANQPVSLSPSSLLC